jgi:hypothetical protein
MAQAEQDRAHRLGDRTAIDRANAKLAYWENVMTRRHPEDVKRVANDPDDGWPTFANYANSLEMEKFGGLKEAGSLYKADLPDEMIDRMLDWDKPLSEQPESVQTILKNLAKKDAEKYGEGGGLDYYMGDPDSYDGESVYRYLAEQQDSQVNTSEYFKNLGIPGIKYMDEGSRGYVVDLFHKGKPYAEHLGEKYPTLQSAQQRITEARAEGFEPKLGTRGTRNFVVFPGEEKKVKILKRE